jgi:hypothetical protein
MKTVSEAYKAAQRSNLIYPVRKVELFRRLPDGSTWETTPTDITTEVVRLDRLAWKLDTDALNEFKASNIRIQVENSTRQWDDGSSRFAGFLRYRSKIRISLGLQLGTITESFPSFTGVIEDVLEDSSAPVINLDVQSMEGLLAGQSAEPAGVQIANELLGVGDGIKSDFFTSQTAVGLIKEIRVAGTPIRPGLRWSASGLNDPLQSAKVSFISIQPAPGQEVRADYIVWKKNQKIEQVVADLLSIVPQVPAAVIEPVAFDPPATREILHTLSTDFALYDLSRAKVGAEEAPPPNDALITMDPMDAKAKWQTGTLSRMNLNRIPGGIEPQWTSQYEGDYVPGDEEVQEEGSPAPFWQELPGTPPGTRTVAGGILSMIQNGTSDYYIMSLGEDAGPSKSLYARFRASKISGDVEIGTIISGSSPVLGAKLWFDSLNRVRVRTNNAYSPGYNVDVTQFHNYRLAFTMTSKNAGTWQIYIDGTQVGSGTVGKADALDQAGIYLHSVAGGAGNTFDVDYLRYNGATNTFPISTWEGVIDYGPHLAGLTTAGLITTLGPFFAEMQGTPTANILFYYSWSADGITYTTPAQLSAGANLGTFTNVNAPRFIKFKIQITASEDPVLLGVKRLFLPALATSNVIDAGGGVVSWDTWSATMVLGSGAISRFSAAVIPAGYGYCRAIGTGDTILTDEAAQLAGVTPDKLLFIALMTTTAATNAPFLRESIFDFTTRTVLVSMANLGGRSVLDVIEELAKIGDFEIGCNGDGKFFFRNKAAGSTSLLTLDDSNVERLSSFSPGWDRVYNRIDASYGDFVKTADSTTENDPAPTSTQRFGMRGLPIGGGDLVFQTDVDLATVMAKRYFARYKEPKRQATVVARFMPELELGDRVTLNIVSPRRIAQNFDGRVLGIAHDLMEQRSEISIIEAA